VSGQYVLRSVDTVVDFFIFFNFLHLKPLTGVLLFSVPIAL